MEGLTPPAEPVAEGCEKRKRKGLSVVFGACCKGGERGIL